MPALRFVTADVFTDRRFGGNPLAVVLDGWAGGRGPEDAVMLAVAREFGYSETVFVAPAADPAQARRLRIFSPAGELPFAGHPTVGTAAALVLLGEVAPVGEVAPARPATGAAVASFVLETGIGAVPVRVTTAPAAGRRRVRAELTAPVLPSPGAPAPSRDALAAVLGVTPADVVDDGRLAPATVLCGATFAMVPLRSAAVLARARVDLGAWNRVFGAASATELYAFVFDDGTEHGAEDGASGRLEARMFAPGLGIVEDPATGAAGVAVAGYFAARSTRLPPGMAPGSAAETGRRRWVIRQGVTMGRPSRIEVEADVSRGAVRAVRVGGEVVLVSEGTLYLDD